MCNIFNTTTNLTDENLFIPTLYARTTKLRQIIITDGRWEIIHVLTKPLTPCSPFIVPSLATAFGYYEF